MPVDISQADQRIPSLFGMPPFKLNAVPTAMLITSHDTIHEGLHAYHNSFNSVEPPPTVNFTGDRVKAYIQHIRLANELTIQKTMLSSNKPYTFAPTLFLEMRARLRGIVGTLHSLIRCGSGLYACAEKFQREAVNYIRGDRPKAKVLPLPVVKDDETTIAGSMNIIVKFMLLTGLLEKTVDNTFVNPPDYKKRHVVMIGDGLTCERFRNFRDQPLER
jgi:hypothetical protein